MGLGVVWLPARAPGGRAPGHPDHDLFWARLAERGAPFVLHVGSGRLPIGSEWMDDGRPRSEQFSGAEIIGSKDFMVVYHTASRFLSVLVLDGVLERHRGLRGGAIEMGAGWVPDMLRRLDHATGDLESLRTAGWRRSNGRRPSRRVHSCASPPIRSKTSVGSLPSRTRASTCSRPTIRMPRAGETPSVDSSAHGPARPRPTTSVDGFFAVNAAGWLGVEQPA